MADSRYAGEAGLQAVFGQIKAAMAEKQDKVNDMGLSHNDYSNAEKQKNAQNASDIVSLNNDIVSLNNDIDDIIEKMDGDATVYPYADVITIEDAVPSNLADCSVKIEPVQDLHGYEKPWVGGAGKNKLPMTTAKLKADNVNGTWNGNVYSYRGIDFTITEDNGGNVIEIDVNGTSNADFATLNVLNASITQGSYKLNGISGGSQTGLRFDLEGIGDYKTLSNGELSVDANTDAEYRFGVTVRTSGITINHQKVYPMIRLATETDTTFAPYTNICPISGHTEASVQRDGKNLLNPLTLKRTNPKAGTPDAQWVWWDFNACVANQQYILNCNVAINNIYYSSVTFYDGSKQFLGDDWHNYSNPNSLTFTTPSGCKYIRIYFYHSSSMADYDFSTAQLELGSSATDYEPFRGKIYTIALGDTIYGGTVDFDSGVMTVTKATTTVTTLVRNNDHSFYQNISPWPKASQLTSSQIICDKAVTGDVQNIDTVFINSSNALRVNTKQAFSTASDAMDYFGGSIDVCYELATSFTVQLTPQQIQLLKGTNTLYASTGQISVTVNGVAGSIGAVQEQVNELADSVVDRFDDVVGWSENKNLLPMTLENLKGANKNQGGSWNGNVYTNKNVSYEVLFDSNGYISGFNVNGTPTEGNSSFIYVMNEPTNVQGNSHICTLGTSSKGSSSTFCITSLSGNWGNQQAVYDKKTISGLVGKVRLEIKDGYTASNLLFKPMLCDDTVVDLTYEPYHDVIGKSVNALLDRVPSAPTTDGTYSLKVTVASGVPTYSWVSNA